MFTEIKTIRSLDENVMKFVFGKEIERMIYAAGAMAGGVTGFYLGKILINL